MTRLGPLLATLRGELLRDDASPGEKALHVAERVTARLRPHVAVSRRLVFELTSPPTVNRNLRDLIVRRGREEDLAPLAGIDDTAPSLVRERFARGDLAYVAALDDEILSHTWFHRGPTPFSEDRIHCADWALEPSMFWSYNGAATPEARSSGIFVKMFQTALRELFVEHGATRVQGFIRDSNTQSVMMHERMGWTRLGVISTVAVPGWKWLRWDGSGVTRQWLVPRASEFALRMPPA